MYDLKFVKSFTNSFEKKQKKESQLIKIYTQLKDVQLINNYYSVSKIISKSITKLKPLAFFKTKKIAGALHFVPIIRAGCNRERFQAIQWLFVGTGFSFKKKMPFIEKVVGVLIRVLKADAFHRSFTQRRKHHRLINSSLTLTKFLRNKKRFNEESSSKN